MSGRPRSEYMRSYKDSQTGGMLGALSKSREKSAKVRRDKQWYLSQLPPAVRAQAKSRNMNLGKLKKLYKQHVKPTTVQTAANEKRLAVATMSDQSRDTLLNAVSMDKFDETRKKMLTWSKPQIATYLYDNNIPLIKRGRTKSLAAPQTGLKKRRTGAVRKEDTEMKTDPEQIRQSTVQQPTVPQPTVPQPLPQQTEETKARVRAATKTAQDLIAAKKRFDGFQEAQKALEQAKRDHQAKLVQQQEAKKANDQQQIENAKKTQALQQQMRDAQQDETEDAPIKVAEIQSNLDQVSEDTNNLQQQQAQQVRSTQNTKNMMDALSGIMPAPEDVELPEEESEADATEAMEAPASEEKAQTVENASRDAVQMVADEYDGDPFDFGADIGEEPSVEMVSANVEMPDVAQQPSTEELERDVAEREMYNQGIAAQRQNIGSAMMGLSGQVQESGIAREDLENRLEDAERQLEKRADYSQLQDAITDLKNQRDDKDIALMDYRNLLDDKTQQHGKLQKQLAVLEQKIATSNAAKMAKVDPQARDKIAKLERTLQQKQAEKQKLQDSMRSIEMNSSRKYQKRFEEQKTALQGDFDKQLKKKFEEAGAKIELK